MLKTPWEPHCDIPVGFLPGCILLLLSSPASWVGHFLTLLILVMTWVFPFFSSNHTLFLIYSVLFLIVLFFWFFISSPTLQTIEILLTCKNSIMEMLPSVLQLGFLMIMLRLEELAVSKYNQIISISNSTPFLFS